MPMTTRSRSAVWSWGVCLLFQVLLFLHQAPAWAAVLALEDGPHRVTFETAALLARSDAAEIAIPADVAYHGPRPYHAVPLAVVLSALLAPPGSTLEAIALDRFAAQIPLALATQT